jgi:hypothetical protein
VQETTVTDGLRVSETGYIFTAADSRLDVVGPYNVVLLGKIVTGNETMDNLVAVPGEE